MKRYTIGALFSPDLERVLLLQKQRPDWQKGRFNFPGGKLELGESVSECIAREFEEETGAVIPATSWHHIGRIENSDKDKTIKKIDTIELHFHEQLELAYALLNDAIASCTRLAFRERKKPQPDEQFIKDMEANKAKALKLLYGDGTFASLQRMRQVIDEYGPFVRALYRAGGEPALENRHYAVDFLTALYDEAQHGPIESMTDERVTWFSSKSLPLNCITNVHWLVSFALNFHAQGRNDRLKFGLFEYEYPE
jgi:8-oxo-dGTP pyrophosphatase MutT (NUDIX family)